MPRSRRVCSYCQEEMGEDEFKCKACGNLVAMKTVPVERAQIEEYEEATLDRYSIGLLVLTAIILPPIAIAIGGVMLFNDAPYKRDTGKLLMTGALVMLVILVFIFIAGSGTLSISF
ncbi:MULTISPECIES: hypothetical protein [Paenibacillus]|uniref:Uncharacterized protein n=1 Tax=Paenibacillus xylanilyticus TaxID=248903 RepID=A0A7Y6EWG7_9BACL|nr:hypothetical protein [Paenibacillus xylanilyticus]NUU76435.1 hypothetical protein [Paenibacillus xylanilyticus]